MLCFVVLLWQWDELKEKLFIYWSIYFSTLTCGHNVSIKTERTRSLIKMAEISFLRWKTPKKAEKFGLESLILWSKKRRGGSGNWLECLHGGSLWEENLVKSKNTLEYSVSGQETLWDPSGQAGECLRGDECLGLPPGPFVYAIRPQISGRNEWMASLNNFNTSMSTSSTLRISLKLMSDRW